MMRSRLMTGTVILLALALHAGLSACSVHLGGPPERAERWERAELYFGMNTRGGGVVSQEQWQAFVDRYVTPRFPTGFTVFAGSGQYQSDETGKIIREPSRVLVVMYPFACRADARIRLQRVAQDYISLFDQESVLQVESDARVEFLLAPATQPAR